MADKSGNGEKGRVSSKGSGYCAELRGKGKPSHSVVVKEVVAAGTGGEWGGDNGGSGRRGRSGTVAHGQIGEKGVGRVGCNNGVRG